MTVIHYKAACSDCGRKILVMLTSIGSPHQFVNSVVCGECVVKKGINKKWAKDNPGEAKELEAWIQDSTETQTPTPSANMEEK